MPELASRGQHARTGMLERTRSSWSGTRKADEQREEDLCDGLDTR